MKQWEKGGSECNKYSLINKYCHCNKYSEQGRQSEDEQTYSLASPQDCGNTSAYSSFGRLPASPAWKLLSDESASVYHKRTLMPTCLGKVP